MDKCNYKKIDWDKYSPEGKNIDMKNTNRHVMNIEFSEHKFKKSDAEKENKENEK